MNIHDPTSLQVNALLCLLVFIVVLAVDIFIHQYLRKVCYYMATTEEEREESKRLTTIVRLLRAESNKNNNPDSFVAYAKIQRKLIRYVPKCEQHHEEIDARVKAQYTRYSRAMKVAVRTVLVLSMWSTVLFSLPAILGAPSSRAAGDDDDLHNKANENYDDDDNESGDGNAGDDNGTGGLNSHMFTLLPLYVQALLWPLSLLTGDYGIKTWLFVCHMVNKEIISKCLPPPPTSISETTCASTSSAACTAGSKKNK